MKKKQLIALFVVVVMIVSMGTMAIAIDEQNINVSNNGVATQEDYEMICLYIEQNFPSDYKLDNDDIAKMLDNLGLAYLDVKPAKDPSVYEIIGIQPRGTKASAQFLYPTASNNIATVYLYLYNETLFGLAETIVFTGNVYAYALAAQTVEVPMMNSAVNESISGFLSQINLGYKYRSYSINFNAGNYVRFEAQLFADGKYMGYLPCTVYK